MDGIDLLPGKSTQYHRRTSSLSFAIIDRLSCRTK
jgi:hypothetical protein